MARSSASCTPTTRPRRRRRRSRARREAHSSRPRTTATCAAVSTHATPRWRTTTPDPARAVMRRRPRRTRAARGARDVDGRGHVTDGASGVALFAHTNRGDLSGIRVDDATRRQTTTPRGGRASDDARRARERIAARCADARRARRARDDARGANARDVVDNE